MPRPHNIVESFGDVESWKKYTESAKKRASSAKIFGYYPYYLSQVVKPEENVTESELYARMGCFTGVNQRRDCFRRRLDFYSSLDFGEDTRTNDRPLLENRETGTYRLNLNYYQTKNIRKPNPEMAKRLSIYELGCLPKEPKTRMLVEKLAATSYCFDVFAKSVEKESPIILNQSALQRIWKASASRRFHNLERIILNET